MLKQRNKLKKIDRFNIYHQLYAYRQYRHKLVEVDLMIHATVHGKLDCSMISCEFSNRNKISLAKCACQHAISDIDFMGFTSIKKCFK